MGVWHPRGPLQRAIPLLKNDIYAAFVERGVQLLCSHGLLGAIYFVYWVFLVEFPTLAGGNSIKKRILLWFSLILLWRPRRRHGRGCRLLPRKECRGGIVRAIFLHSEYDDKATALRATIKSPCGRISTRRFSVETESFQAIPGAPFAYWVSEGYGNSSW